MRSRYLYRPGHPLANERGFVAAADAAIEPEALDVGRQPVFTDRYMEGVKAPDGTDIGNRARRRAWMKATNSVDSSDMTETRAKAAAQREKHFTDGSDDKKARREAVGRAVYQIRNGARR